MPDLRADVASLLTTVVLNTEPGATMDGDPFAFVHLDGSPLTDTERDMVRSATRKELEASVDYADRAARYAAEQAADASRVVELLNPYFERHPEAATVDDVVPLMSDTDRAEFLQLMERVAPDGTIVLTGGEE